MRKIIFLLWVTIVSLPVFSQSLADKIASASLQLSAVEVKKQAILDQLEDLKLQKIQADLESIGLPAVSHGEQLVKHSAFYLSYAEKYEQARWVAHIITPDIISGVVFRTNDFRVDSLVSTGSAVEEDYFLKARKTDSTYIYDGFGFDRGHLAPSADFRWSQKALSESYYYSNMSPQRPEFNRGGWGDLEDVLRSYVFAQKDVQLYVLTGPVLHPDLPRMERGKNKVAIPASYWKIALDMKNKKAIGFIMPNQVIEKPIYSYAVSIRDIEKQTGLNFFNKLPQSLQDQLETQLDPSAWFAAKAMADVEPLNQELLPRNYFNTSIAKTYVNKNEELTVCGTVVGARMSRAGNILINLDKQFPNQVFTVFVKKEDIVNFNYSLTESLNGKVICIKGKVINSGGTATMYVASQADLTIQK